MKIKQLLLISLLFVFSATLLAQGDWTPLFNGKNLNGWKQLNGNAKYEVENEMIIGTTVINTPNSFLATKNDYGDFILEFEFWVDPSLNSGVQIRSHSLKEYNNGRVHGYQVEIDPSDRAWSAGIYDEARRGWLYSLEENPKAQQAFKQNKWNHYHIEAIGQEIKTWINGVPAANLMDDADSSGFIALQVHGIGGNTSREGIKIKWRNIKIVTTDLEKHTWPGMEKVPQKSTIPNTLTKQEMQEGWSLLWDGKTSAGWRGANKNAFPSEGWVMENGVLTVRESGGGESAYGGDIVTENEYSSFTLSLDFKLTKGANSGIKYLVTEGQNKGIGSAIGLEYQLLDDQEHPDAANGVDGNRTLASLYDLIPARDDKPVHAPGQWNHARIVVDGKHVEHWLNGKKVLEFERATQMFDALVQKSKYAGYEQFGTHEKGRILLQDHGNTVRFKNIKIKEHESVSQ